VSTGLEVLVPRLSASAPATGTGLREHTVDDLWGYCRECYYAELCMAGCTAVAEPVMGRPGNKPFAIIG
jgi:radical SAM protein with 4Fe4S-binding SPASM domain